MQALKLPVYFSCRHCETVFRATQVRQPGAGSYICRACGTPVHEWSGPYNFVDWKPVAN
jgi:predicted RNA-binding Zn-ribbon protein involved in translation (DUF1610 family)